MSSLITWQGVLNLVLILVTGALAYLYWRKGAAEASERTAEVYKELNAALDEQVRSLKAQVERNTCQSAETLRAQAVQEKRLYRVEMESQRKDRLYRAALEEVRLLEDVVRMIVPQLSRLDHADKERIEVTLRTLQEFRLRSHREQLDWEETKDIMQLYMEPTRQMAPADPAPESAAMHRRHHHSSNSGEGLTGGQGGGNYGGPAGEGD